MNEHSLAWERKELLQSGGGQRCCPHRAPSLLVSHSFLTCSLHWTAISFFSHLFLYPFLQIPMFLFALIWVCFYLSLTHTRSILISLFLIPFSLFIHHSFKTGPAPWLTKNDRPMNQPLILRLPYFLQHKHTVCRQNKIHTVSMQATSLSHSGHPKRITLVSW